jgi:serine/threonine-protein kinase TNNI3K
MIRLAAAIPRLPRSLYIRDIDIGRERDPVTMGGHADIFTAQYRGHPVALKRLRRLNVRESDFHKVSRLRHITLLYAGGLIHRQGLCREALVWRQLKHPFILPFIGIDDITFASTGFLCLVSPWMHRGTLKHFMKTPDYMPARDLHRLV